MLEVFVAHNTHLQFNVGFDAVDDQLLQGVLHAGDRHITRFAVADQFTDHGIIVRRHGVAGVNMRFPAYTKAARRVETRDFARAWQEGVRVFGVDTAFYRMAFDHNFFLFDGQWLTRSDTQLLFDQVNAGDHFGNRVFNLNTGVHLNEVELAVFEQEL